MVKYLGLALGVWICVASMSGCCCSPCFSGGQGTNPYSRWTGFGNARIAPPATNSYQVAAGSQPYYTPGSTGTSTNAAIPNLSGVATSGVGSAMPNTAGFASANPQMGWRTPDAASTGFYGSAPSTAGNLPTMTNTSIANDYQSTMTDERFDSTRLPANDATMVRAPTQFNPQGNWQTLNPSGTVANLQVPGQLEYRATPQINGLAASQPMNYPSLPPLNQTAPVVLAQSSTSPETLARDPNYQAGWRDRFTGGTYLNR